MERLTIWNEQTEMAELIDWDTEEWKEFMSDFDVPVQISLGVAIDKLAHYEDLEEQGLLLKLPCKVGTVVYEVAGVVDWDTGEEFEMPIKTLFEPSMIEQFGKTVFLTKEEAERKLERIKNNE